MKRVLHLLKIIHGRATTPLESEFINPKVLVDKYDRAWGFPILDAFGHKSRLEKIGTDLFLVTDASFEKIAILDLGTLVLLYAAFNYDNSILFVMTLYSLFILVSWTVCIVTHELSKRKLQKPNSSDSHPSSHGKK